MNRETTTFTTPNENHEVVIKTYLTGLEKREITGASLPKSVDYNLAGGGDTKLDLAEMTARAEDAVMRNIIVSIDGKTDNIIETVLAMRSQDSDFVISKVKEVAEGLTEEKKTQ